MKDISSEKLEMYPALLGWMEKKSKKHTAKELEVLAQTIIFEPGNCLDGEEDAERMCAESCITISPRVCRQLVQNYCGGRGCTFVYMQGGIGLETACVPWIGGSKDMH